MYFRPGFMRYASTGYFVVYMEPELDVPATIPPATIMDLQAIEFTESKTKLRFTATGADLDYQAGINHYQAGINRRLQIRDRLCMQCVGIISLLNSHSTIYK